MFKLISTIMVFILSCIVVLPSFFNVSLGLPFEKKLTFGLDLLGGTHLVLQADFDQYVQDDLEGLITEIRQILKGHKLQGSVTMGDGRLLVHPSSNSMQKPILEALVLNLGLEYKTETVGQNIFVQHTESYASFLRREIIKKSVATLTRRRDSVGTKEATIQPYARDKIIIQIPNERDLTRISGLIGRTAKLKFILVDQGKLNSEVQLGGEYLVSANLAYNRIGSPVVSFKFNSEGTRKLSKITTENVGKKLAIVLDNKILNSPVIREPILSGTGEINGRFTFQEAQDLAMLLSSGSLPAPLKIVEERIVDSSLGKGAIESAKKASFAAFLLVSMFMVMIYKISGLWASISLIFNLSIILMFVVLLQVTLTFPGIAGLILTIGMAVDANVLIFERIKEEIKKYKNRAEAIERGFKNAFNTILDSNITTLITAALMFFIGTGPLKGFALMLSLGILTSMFSAISITNILLSSSHRFKHLF